MKCPNCGNTMNHHADKVVMASLDGYDDFHDEVVEAFSCPHCGFNAAREMQAGMRS